MLMTVLGPTKTSGDVRIRAAFRGIADIRIRAARGVGSWHRAASRKLDASDSLGVTIDAS
jgi:hypothetical protein